MEVGRLLREEPDQWAAYVAGAGVKGRGKILDTFARGAKKPEWKSEFRALSLRFENPRQFLPLQAADIVAYELHHLLPRVRGLDVRPVRRHRLEALDAAPRRKWIDLTDETLENFAKALSIKVEYEAERAGRRRQRRGK
jgi:hypothetical protein